MYAYVTVSIISVWQNKKKNKKNSHVNKFSAEVIAVAARKPQFYVLLDFSKLKTLGQVLDLFTKITDQRVSPGKT